MIHFLCQCVVVRVAPGSGETVLLLETSESGGAHSTSQVC